MHALVRRFVPFITLAASLAACGRSDGVTAVAAPPATAGIKAVAGGSVSDTILSAPIQALIVEVRGPGGTLARGATVRFTVQSPSDTTRRSEQTLYVCTLAAAICGPQSASLAPFANVAADTVDANGHAKALLRLGTVAGPTYVIVTVPEFGLRDSVPFTIAPGAARTVRFATRDVGIFESAQATLNAAVADSYGTRRSDAVTYSLGTTPGVATISGGTVTATDIGQVYAYARAGTAVDSVLVRVVPAGRLLVWDALSRLIGLVSTDGSAPRQLASSISSDFGAFPHFGGGGGAVAFQAGASDAFGGVPSRIIVMDSLGGARREVALPAGVTSLRQPRLLADGTLLVVGRGASQFTSTGYVTPTAIYSITTTGTATRLATLPTASTVYGGADISPDGTRVAYVSDPLGSGGPGPLQVLTIATGQVTQVAPTAIGPAWSPSGTRIAYLVPVSGSFSTTDGTLAVINADGSGAAALTAAGTLSVGLAWSPAGTYVLGRSAAVAALRAVRVRDGANVLLRLPSLGTGTFSTDYYQPDWR